MGRVSKEIPGSGSGSGTRWALKVLFHDDESQNDNDEEYNDDVVTGLVTTPLISSSSLLTLSLNVLFVQENGGLRHVMEDLNRVARSSN